YIPGKPRFEITITPGRIVSSLRGKSGNACVYGPLPSLPLQTEHRISREDIFARRVLVVKPDALVPLVYTPTVRTKVKCVELIREHQLVPLRLRRRCRLSWEWLLTQCSV